MQWISQLVILLLLFCSPAFAASQATVASDNCVDCHTEDQYQQGFTSSVHGLNGCTSCHISLPNQEGHPVSASNTSQIDCGRCHRAEEAAHATSVHQSAELGCKDCHLEIHTQRAWNGVKQTAVDICQTCHSIDDYTKSIHGQAVASGNQDSAACPDCHSMHAVQATSTLSLNQATKVCIGCHDDSKKMARNGVPFGRVKSFVDSYHGKSYSLGSTKPAAGCADCHNAHLVLPESDPASSVNSANMVTTCAKCHPAATPLFTKFYAHGDEHDSKNYPVLYWTFLGMTGLLVGTFALFWLHSVLWMFRGFVDTRQKLAAQARGEGEVIPAAHKQYRRFSKRHIFFHIIVIVSFLGLSLTGLPLKFSDQAWAETLMSFFGGVELAGLLHRACAVLTFYYFLAALLMTFDFLFISKKPKGNWLQRLFGPDSLMPNFKDLRDLNGMIKWFLFRGPLPKFERWTYWEKFDFLAVFWGMFAIGGSGLMLWFPEFFGQFLPGWVFNVATIVHSDEALLATGFIFTVHFFNTHGRPGKFPMDFVIFNGRISKEEFIEERGAQWERYQKDGIIEEFEVSKPSHIIYEFIMKSFGFLAFFTGLALAFLMFVAFITGR
ncbi:cytochrome c3 family protein [Geopsychrobacter electrodiphilus]|uniref:cytochrome c3 family protein n=1 Tax=Geopsychrobacter electrodiphilus TaxID=225196 RepID=UPI0003A0D95F|nr:cytochrome c3 family protein [Geopsychrobacter electrodiphilus]